MTGFGRKVQYRSEPWATGMNDTLDQVILGLNIYPPDIRERARW
jgi:hypothetical protein